MSISKMLLDAAYSGNKSARTVVAELLGTIKLYQISDEQAQVIAKVVKPVRAGVRIQNPTTEQE